MQGRRVHRMQEASLAAADAVQGSLGEGLPNKAAGGGWGFWQGCRVLSGLCGRCGFNRMLL
jgi:hypothetical protein